jgi:hypothetical protein
MASDASYWDALRIAISKNRLGKRRRCDLQSADAMAMIRASPFARREIVMNRDEVD